MVKAVNLAKLVNKAVSLVKKTAQAKLLRQVRAAALKGVVGKAVHKEALIEALRLCAVAPARQLRIY